MKIVDLATGKSALPAFLHRPVSLGAAASDGDGPSNVISAPMKASRPPMPATAKLAALDAARREHGGVPVPPPLPLHELALAKTYTDEQSQSQLPNAELKAAKAWFRSIVDAGGHPDDLGLAWILWEPQTQASLNKYWLEAEFLQMKNEAGKAWAALHTEAEREREPERKLQALRAELKPAEDKFRKAFEELEKAQDELQKWQAPLDAFLAEHPWLNN
jgi:hypothetical protein